MKLLTRTLRGFVIYSVAVLLVLTPVFYLVVNGIIISNVDKTLLLHKKEIATRLETLPTEGDVQQWEDLDGEVVVEPADGLTTGDSTYTINQVNPFSGETELYRVLSTSVSIKGHAYRLRAQISLVESEDLIKALAITQLIVLTVLLAGMLLINWWQSESVWKPFYRTLAQLKSFQLERNNGVDLMSSSVTEFNDLNSAIEELTRRDKKAYLSQREFTENAAHEMQTPLAVFQTKLDMLLQTKPTDDQAPLIESLLDATVRLNKLNKTLVLLSRIDAGQFPDRENVRLISFTDRIVNLYKTEADNKNINIEVRTAITNDGVQFNASLLDILLSNLVSNAIRHSPVNTNVIINIESALWEIRNPGPPLNMPIEKIFERFQKGTTNPSSLGLGMAIVKKICDNCELTLSYRYENGAHTFSIGFPESKVSPKSIA